MPVTKKQVLDLLTKAQKGIREGGTQSALLHIAAAKRGVAQLREPPPLDPPAPAPEPTPAPDPPPAPAPPPTPQPDLFNGSKISDFKVEAVREHVSETTIDGRACIRLEVHEGDVKPLTPTDNPRAQLLTPNLIKPGTEFWLATDLYIPQDFPFVEDWLSLISIYGAPFNGSSPWQIEIVGDKLQWMRNAGGRYAVPWSITCPKGRWVSVLHHERFASDGWVETWVDGNLVCPKYALATVDASNNGAPNYAKIMHYRAKGQFDQASVYFTGLRLGTTRASVGG
jgi:hypothetical protein